MDILSIIDDYRKGIVTTRDLAARLEQAWDGCLSDGQRGLWALYRAEPEGHAYNVGFCLSCRPGLTRRSSNARFGSWPSATPSSGHASTRRG